MTLSPTSNVTSLPVRKRFRWKVLSCQQSTKYSRLRPLLQREWPKNRHFLSISAPDQVAALCGLKCLSCAGLHSRGRTRARRHGPREACLCRGRNVLQLDEVDVDRLRE